MAIAKTAEQTVKHESTRLQLIDIFKIICVMLTVSYHVWMVFVNQDTAEGTPYVYYDILQSHHSFFFQYSGLWITATSFFFFGLHPRSLKVWRLALCVVGIVLIQHLELPNVSWYSPTSYTWGVFSFIFFAYLIVLLIHRSPRKIQWPLLLLISSVLFVPHSLWRSWLGEMPSGVLKQALIGDWDENSVATGWFLLPWLGFLVLSFSFGKWVEQKKDWFLKWHFTFDAGLLAGVTIATISYIHSAPDFFGGPRYNQSVFWHDPQELWLIVLFPLLIYRYSLLEIVQKKLADNRLVRWISATYWCRQFWLCYLLHFSLLVLAEFLFSEAILNHPILLQTLWIILFYCSDRFAYGLNDKYQQIRRFKKVSI